MFLNTQGWGKQKNIDQADLGLCPRYLWGAYTVREAHSEHAKHALLLGGSGGMPPQENFEKTLLKN